MKTGEKNGKLRSSLEITIPHVEGCMEVKMNRCVTVIAESRNYYPSRGGMYNLNHLT